MVGCRDSGQQLQGFVLFDEKSIETSVDDY